MNNYFNANGMLLGQKFRKKGIRILFLGIPILILYKMFLPLLDSYNGQAYYLSDGITLVTFLPQVSGPFLLLIVTIGLYFILFAQEEHEDEMFLMIRMRAIMNAIKITIALVILFAFLDLLDSIKGLERSRMSGLGLIMYMLLFANVIYWYIKRKLASDEE